MRDNIEMGIIIGDGVLDVIIPNKLNKKKVIFVYPNLRVGETYDQAKIRFDKILEAEINSIDNQIKGTANFLIFLIPLNAIWKAEGTYERVLDQLDKELGRPAISSMLNNNPGFDINDFFCYNNFEKLYKNADFGIMILPHNCYLYTDLLIKYLLLKKDILIYTTEIENIQKLINEHTDKGDEFLVATNSVRLQEIKEKFLPQLNKELLELQNKLDTLHDGEELSTQGDDNRKIDEILVSRFNDFLIEFSTNFKFFNGFEPVNKR